ncbi:CHASE2 domain-containing protein [Roseateles sp. L2-2]|uniref:CHASE2 domain-containing protein n=1 Tax=Roseateles sp. L2-2 TaxID=3422597 RepID=UPI003D367A6F
MAETGARLPRVAWLVPIVAMLAAMTLLVHDPVPLRVARNAVFDQFQRWYPRPYLAPSVRIVDIDEESLRRFGQWPWSRAQVARLLDAAQQLEPASVSLDIMFPEPEGQTRADTGGNASDDPDQSLAQALRSGRVALGVALTGPRLGGDAAQAAGGTLLSKAGFIAVGGEPTRSVPAFSSSVSNLRDLQLAAAGQGAMTFMPDVDGVVRRVPLLFSLQGRPVPSLTAEALRLAAGADAYVVHSAADAGGVVDLRIGGHRIDTDQTGALWMHFARPQAERYLPAWQLLEGRVPPASLKGRLVLIGTSAQGLLDLRFSPLGGVIPGVEVHAQALEQIVSGQQLRRPGWVPATEAIVALLGCIAVGIVAMRARPGRSSLLFLGLVGAIGLGAWTSFRFERLLLDPGAPVLAMALVFAPTMLMRHRWAERRQRWMQTTFSRYVSPNLIDYLVANPQALELGGRRQRCSFVFTDLQGFTARMESMDPAVAVSVLNTYLDRMIAIAFKHDGTLDRIVGDAVAIMFSAPVPQADHEARALRCALEMQAFAREHVDVLGRQGIAFCDTRIGVHSGEVTVGNFGGATLFDYRALGDPVNTAARLEGANKFLGTSLCVSEETLRGCPGAVTRPIGRLRLAGRSSYLRVHEALAADGGSVEADLDYAHAFALMRDGSDEALAAFEVLATSRPEDRLVALHVNRLRAGSRDDAIDLLAK